MKVKTSDCEFKVGDIIKAKRKACGHSPSSGFVCVGAEDMFLVVEISPNKSTMSVMDVVGRFIYFLTSTQAFICV